MYWDLLCNFDRPPIQGRYHSLEADGIRLARAAVSWRDRRHRELACLASALSRTSALAVHVCYLGILAKRKVRYAHYGKSRPAGRVLSKSLWLRCGDRLAPSRTNVVMCFGASTNAVARAIFICESARVEQFLPLTKRSGAICQSLPVFTLELARLPPHRS